MKMVYHISYDLKNPGKDYSHLYKAIKDLGDWCHPLDSTWYVDTTHTAKTVRDHLRTVTDSNDKVIVTAATVPGAWFGISDEASAWLKNHL